MCLAAFFAVFIADKTLSGGLVGVIGGKYGWLLPFALYLAVYAAIGYDVLWRALRGILHGQMLDENFLMCIATLGAFALAIYTGASGLAPEGFDEGCAVLLFYQVGEFFQDYATGRSRKSISALMDIRPDSANVLRDGKTLSVDPSEVKVGEIVVVNPGEKVPREDDGVVFRARRKSAKDVVRLVPFLADHGDFHQSEQLFEGLELLGKFRIHRLSGPLVRGVKFMTEGGRFEVERRRHVGGGKILDYFEKNVQEAVNGARVGAFGSFEVWERVISAVHDAVRIYEQNFVLRHISPSRQAMRRCSPPRWRGRRRRNQAV